MPTGKGRKGRPAYTRDPSPHEDPSPYVGLMTDNWKVSAGISFSPPLPPSPPLVFFKVQSLFTEPAICWTQALRWTVLVTGGLPDRVGPLGVGWKV